jgi:hypothetical protein
MKVMTAPDMFAHKLCALLDRSVFTNRDLFDCWFFLHHQTKINQQIVEERMQKGIADYLQDCIDYLEKLSDNKLLNGLGEMVDQEMKNFIKTKIRTETISLLQFFQAMPLLEDYSNTSIH